MSDFEVYSREHWASLSQDGRADAARRLVAEVVRLRLTDSIWLIGFFEAQRLVIVARAEEGTNIACQKWIESLPLDNCLATIREKISTTTTK